MDAAAVKKAVELSGGKLITVEDHYAQVFIHCRLAALEELSQGTD